MKQNLIENQLSFEKSTFFEKSKLTHKIGTISFRPHLFLLNLASQLASNANLFNRILCYINQPLVTFTTILTLNSKKFLSQRCLAEGRFEHFLA